MGSRLVLSRGAGESRHGRGVVWNQYWDLVRVSANGGDAQFVTRVTNGPDGSSGSAFNNIRNQIVRPSLRPRRPHLLPAPVHRGVDDRDGPVLDPSRRHRPPRRT